MTYKIKGAIRLTAKPKTHGAVAACLWRVDVWLGLSAHTSCLFSVRISYKYDIVWNGVHFKQQNEDFSLKWRHWILIHDWLSPLPHNFIIRYQNGDLCLEQANGK